MIKNNNNTHRTQTGFTLIEVLLALMVIAIGLAALLKSTAQSISNTQRIQEKAISHWVAMQGVYMVQLGLVPVKLNQDVSQVTKIFNQKWYWRISTVKTQMKSVQLITIKVSKNQAGPFNDSLIAFRYVENDQ